MIDQPWEQPLRAARKAAGLCYRCGQAPAFKAALCERHYAEALTANRRRAQARRAAGPQEPQSAADRFWSKVDKSDGPDACWPWRSWRNHQGYGRLRLDGKQTFAWELTNGPIADGLCVLHRCDNPPCVNLAHLFLGTNLDNIADKVAKGRAPGRPKLTASDVGTLIEMYQAGRTLHEITEHFGISYRCASQAVSGDTWGRVHAVRAAGGGR